MKSIATVYQTETPEEYELFKTITGNRLVKPLHILRLRNSFEKSYLFSPIIVNAKLEIIDGQHRFKAAKELGLPINYIIMENYGLKEIQILNSNMSNWTKMDYLESYVELGIKSYIVFKQFMEDYPEFNFQTCETLLMNKSQNALTNSAPHSGNYGIKTFEEGTMFITHEYTARRNADFLIQLKDLYAHFNNTQFVKFFINIIKNKDFDFDRLISQMRKFPKKILPCSTIGEHADMIETLYNYHRKDKLNMKYWKPKQS